jgi:hypothetical protein
MLNFPLMHGTEQANVVVTFPMTYILVVLSLNIGKNKSGLLRNVLTFGRTRSILCRVHKFGV